MHKKLSVAFAGDYHFTHRDAAVGAWGATETLYTRMCLALATSDAVDVVVLYHGPTAFVDRVRYVNFHQQAKSYDAVILNRRAASRALLTCTYHRLYLWAHDEFPRDAGINETLAADPKITVVCVSEWQKQAYVRAFPLLRAVVIHNFVDPVLFDPDPPSTAKTKTYDVAYLSAHMKGTRHPLFWQRLMGLAQTFRVVVVTPSYNPPGAYDVNVLQRAGIRVLTPLSKPRLLREVLQQTRVVVGPIFPETFGCFAAEAMFFGVPVLVHKDNVGALHEIVPRSSIIDFFRPGDLERAITDAHLLDVPHERFHIRDAVRSWLNLLYQRDQA